MSVTFSSSPPPSGAAQSIPNQDLIQLLLNPDSQVVYSTDGSPIKYTTDGTNPIHSNTSIYVQSGIKFILNTGNHMVIKAVSFDGVEYSEVSIKQHDIEVFIKVHPEKEIYNIGDVVTATLNSNINNEIQTYEDYRWNNEQVEHRFDAPEDDDRFLGPRPTFTLNKVGKFRIKSFFKDFGFKSRRVDKIIEVFPTLKIKYKGQTTNIRQTIITINEKNDDIPFLGVESSDLSDLDKTGKKPTPPGGIPRT